MEEGSMSPGLSLAGGGKQCSLPIFGDWKHSDSGGSMATFSHEFSERRRLRVLVKRELRAAASAADSLSEAESSSETPFQTEPLKVPPGSEPLKGLLETEASKASSGIEAYGSSSGTEACSSSSVMEAYSSSSGTEACSCSSVTEAYSSSSGTEAFGSSPGGNEAFGSPTRPTIPHSFASWLEPKTPPQSSEPAPGSRIAHQDRAGSGTPSYPKARSAGTVSADAGSGAGGAGLGKGRSSSLSVQTATERSSPIRVPRMPRFGGWPEDASEDANIETFSKQFSDLARQRYKAKRENRVGKFQQQQQTVQQQLLQKEEQEQEKQKEQKEQKEQMQGGKGGGEERVHPRPATSQQETSWVSRGLQDEQGELGKNEDVEGEITLHLEGDHDHDEAVSEAVMSITVEQGHGLSFKQGGKVLGTVLWMAFGSHQRSVKRISTL